jgi:hypothetical protein
MSLLKLSARDVIKHSLKRSKLSINKESMLGHQTKHRLQLQPQELAHLHPLKYNQLNLSSQKLQLRKIFCPNFLALADSSVNEDLLPPPQLNPLNNNLNPDLRDPPQTLMQLGADESFLSPLATRPS